MVLKEASKKMDFSFMSGTVWGALRKRGSDQPSFTYEKTDLRKTWDDVANVGSHGFNQVLF